jgi:hypothetical protein
MNSLKTRQSTLVFLGLPVGVGITLLGVALGIALLPYLAGQELLGIAMPELTAGMSKTLLWIGPALLGIVLVSFFPLWPVLKAGTPSDDDVRQWATEHGFSNPYDLGIRNYEQCLRDLGYRRMKKLKTI